MTINELIVSINLHLDELEAALQALDVTPKLVELDTRIQALTGQVQAKVTPGA